MQAQQRQTAVKTRISDLLKGRYVVQEGWEPNYILVGDKKISRVNLMGVVVSKQNSENSRNEMVVIDDGTGRISTRSFEEQNFSYISVGDVVMLIGRPREYGSEVYIVPEIIKSIDNKRWVNVRMLELKLAVGNLQQAQDIRTNVDATVKNGKNSEETPLDLSEKGISAGGEAAAQETKEEGGDEMTVAEKILSLIRDSDKGDGADSQEIVEKSETQNAEHIITDLLKNGDIFELKPGKLKVLE